MKTKRISKLDGSEWEENYIELLRNEKNKKLINYYSDHVGNLFDSEEYCQKVIDFLENSKYKLNLEEREGCSPHIIKLKDKYYDTIEETIIWNTKLKKGLILAIYREVDLEYSKELAVKNLTLTVEGDLSLRDKRIIRDIALENLCSNFEKAVSGKYPELYNWISCIRTDLYDGPKNQLMSYGFKIKHRRFLDIKF